MKKQGWCASVERQKRNFKATIGDYELTVHDYGYTSRAPVLVMVSGTRLGERVNHLGEPCYFYQSESAMTLQEGIEIGKAIIAGRTVTQ